jgi:hypothetical protein
LFQLKRTTKSDARDWREIASKLDVPPGGSSSTWRLDSSGNGWRWLSRNAACTSTEIEKTLPETTFADLGVIGEPGAYAMLADPVDDDVFEIIITLGHDLDVGAGEDVAAPSGDGATLTGEAQGSLDGVFDEDRAKDPGGGDRRRPRQHDPRRRGPSRTEPQGTQGDAETQGRATGEGRGRVR